MKVKITLAAKKTWTEEYPDNNFSDEVIENNFWLYTFKDDEWMDVAKIKIQRFLEEGEDPVPHFKEDEES